MFDKNTRTKVIWSVSQASFLRCNHRQLADDLISGPQMALRAIYSPLLATQLTLLRKELVAALQHEKKCQDPWGVFPFMLALTGRRAVLKVPADVRIFKKGECLTILVREDLSAATDYEYDSTNVKQPEIVITSADMLKDFCPGMVLTLSFGQARLLVDQVQPAHDGCLQLSVTVELEGNVLSGMDVASPQLNKALFPLLPHDQQALETKFSNLCDFLIIHGIRSREELLEVKKIVLGQSEGSIRHPSVIIGPAVYQPDAQVSPKFIFKVDSQSTLDLLPSLLRDIDGVYLSRSELGLTMDPYSVPIIQKELIARCNQNAKLMIVASELMYSMRFNSTPTRAEVSDMANLVADGADALMLAEEVTEGPYRKEVAVVSWETLRNSEKVTEANWHRVPFKVESEDDAVAYGAVEVAERSGAKAIVCVTEGGYTAQRLASLRPPVPIYAICYNRQVMRQLQLLSSLQPMLLDSAPEFERILAVTKELLVKFHGFQRKEKIIFVSLTASSVAERNSNLFTMQEID